MHWLADPSRSVLLAAMFLVLGGCASTGVHAGPKRTESGFDRTEQVADGVRHTTTGLEGSDGIALHVESWTPASAPSRAALIVMHGLKDYGARYAPLAAHLVPKGISVYAFDLRGHAHSAGERVRIGRFGEYVDDLALFVRWVRTQEKDRPVFLLGHSMGGAIVTRYVQRDQPKVAGVILSAAALTSDVSGFTSGFTQFTGNVFPGARVLDLPNEAFSRSEAVVAAMATDPLVDNRGVPARTVGELLHAQEEIARDAALLKAPLLLLHGKKDTVTPPAGSEHLSKVAGASDKTLKLYDGLVHDLLHEPEAARVLADVEGWIDARVEGEE